RTHDLPFGHRPCRATRHEKRDESCQQYVAHMSSPSATLVARARFRFSHQRRLGAGPNGAERAGLLALMSRTENRAEASAQRARARATASRSASMLTGFSTTKST